MDTIAVETLKQDISFTGDLYLDGSFILVPRSVPVTQELINSLKNWGIENILCEGSVSLGGDIGLSTEEKDTNSAKDKDNSSISADVKKAIESSKTQKIGNNDEARMKMVEDVYTEYMNYIERVFTYYTTHKKIDEEELSETVKELVSFIKDHKRYMLRINPSSEATHKNFLVIHSMRTTVLALAIAMQLHMPLSKVIELGVTCILHEIGMLRLPPQLYMSDKKLSASEKAHITKHTLFGYQILKDLGFPSQITLGVLEHHENEIGTGYPRKMTGADISTTAKIIFAACSYEAISSQRSYKDERSTFEAIVELIMNKENKYDPNVIKALLYTVSFYPIGSYVYLSNRKVALVIDVNPDNPKCPVVQLLAEKEKDGSYKTLTTGENDITIVRILTKNEKNDILKLIEEKRKLIEEAKSESEQNQTAAAVNTEEQDEKPAENTQTSSESNNGEEEIIDISFFS